MLKKNSIEKKNSKKNLTPNPRQAIPPVACLLSAKTNPQEEPSPAPAPGFVCGVARAQRIFAPNIRPTKNPPVRPYFKNKIFTKKKLLQFFSPETPDASRNRY